MAELLLAKLQEANVPAWRSNKYSNTIYFKRPKIEIVKKYALACSEYADFGELAHVVAMQYFTPELVDKIVADISSAI